MKYDFKSVKEALARFLDVRTIDEELVYKTMQAMESNLEKLVEQDQQDSILEILYKEQLSDKNRQIQQLTAKVLDFEGKERENRRREGEYQLRLKSLKKERQLAEAAVKRLASTLIETKKTRHILLYHLTAIIRSLGERVPVSSYIFNTLSKKYPTHKPFYGLEFDLEGGQVVYREKTSEEFEKDGIAPCNETLFDLTTRD